jgi:hypothetical protein
MSGVEEMPKREMSVNIRKATNGFVVSCYNGKTDKTYVYENLSDALEELESIFSVAKEEKEED